MATVEKFPTSAIRKSNPHFSRLKSTVETAFYSNNVTLVSTMEDAYNRSLESPNTIVLDAEVKHAEELGLPAGAKQLLTQDGRVFGRTAKARRNYGDNPEEDEKLLGIVRDAIFQGSHEPFLRSSAYVGLAEDFMVKAHITMPATQSNNLYSWLMNFQITNPVYDELYAKSKKYPENDLYIFFYPEFKHPDYPMGLSYFDSDHNVVAILGMNYFGEIKKGTLTLAWGTAARNGYVACHGGLKIFRTESDAHVASFFGLSGSGKSTLTHAKHDGRYDIQVLHDDAFIVSIADGSSIALEPSYFDKTNDYPAGHPEQDYFVTLQNVGVTLDENGKKALVTEDIRNGNGRTVKSRYSTANRVDQITDPIDAIYWIMKDDSLPPIVKITDPLLASAFGATLATKRSTAENTTDDRDALVIEPYANPFRVYPLVEDYEKFKALFEKGVECYIINTGEFLGKKVTPRDTLGVIEGNVNRSAVFKPFGPLEHFEFVEIDGFDVPFDDDVYLDYLKGRMQGRLDFIANFNAQHTQNLLPNEIIEAFQKIVRTIN
ncbi:phosphoenolpyruvate carboxykinase (ATP) [Aerococcaceae bacterium DSM 109653]|uniref:phosphoenolpyruvate carboxykinase (ATP) n=1 Tax=Fundicoccus ignavus TaxID=2664442 RepID=A0A844BYU1_9LACT|nr:phosphoenolpyruvate carboxykinase (ATP) [Fundicoccus ignavus]MRI81626.1 phosphoenolpyruvate carboxykinase (ATP) [Fundicoccus ignavus]